MVISSSNRSPSPMSRRPNPNPKPSPNSRNGQEREGVGVRKSFSGYPFAKSSIVTQPRNFTPNTPANSPAEYARRSSFGRECGLSFEDHEQKENERDPNTKPVVRVRSPSIIKGTKNFMSPTISAASKISPSPRKKVLGERNEAIRSSASLFEGKFHFYSADDNELKADMGTPPCSTISDYSKVDKVFITESENNVADLSPGVGKVESEPDLVVISPEIALNTTKSYETLPLSDKPKTVVDNDVGFSSPSVIAPLDVDPFHPPYDPKTNFLSPRPQFLHYKPNPRIESFINQGIRLEDDFASDSVSETSQEVQEETSSSVETSPVKDQPPSSEMSSPESQELIEVNEAEIEPRPRFSGKWKTVTFLFLIVLGSMSLSMYSPGFGSYMNQEAIVSQYYSNSLLAVDLAKESFNGLFLNAKVWSAQSVGYLCHMIFKAGEVKFSLLPFSNLTGWQQEEVDDFVVKGFQLRPFFGEETELRNEDEQSSGFLPATNLVIEDFVMQDEGSVVGVTEEASLFDTSVIHNQCQSDLKVENQPFSSSPQGPEVHSHVTTTNVPFNDVVSESEKRVEAESVLESLVLEATEESSPEASERSLTPSTTAINLVVVSLLAFTTFMITKNSKKATSAVTTPSADHFEQKQKLTYIPVASEIDPKGQENLYSCSGPVEVEMIGESCPSELSSFQMTSSYYKKSPSYEAESVEKSSKRNYKRESLASSSSEYTMSSSYGSFTTYSIVHSKQRDDEVVTPVRRSSRIRSKVTSP